MKRSLYILALTTGLAQAASSDQVGCTECTAREAAQLPQQVEDVLLAMTRPAIEALDGEIVVVENVSEMGVSRRPVVLLETSVGALYKKLVTEGFNKTLTSNGKVVKKANKMFTEAINSHFVSGELNKAEQAKEDPAQALTHWMGYSRHFGAYLKSLLVRNKVSLDPKPTARETIETNAHIELFDKELTNYMAGQLAIGFSLRLQLEKNPKVFAQKFKAFLPLVAAAISTPSSVPFV